MVNFNVQAEAFAPWTELYNDVHAWVSAGPSTDITFDDGNDLISLTWIREKVGDETKWGIRFNHAQVDYIGMIEEVAQVNFISIINLDDDGKPMYFNPEFDSDGMPHLEQSDPVGLLERYGFIKQQTKDRWIKFF